MEDLPVPRATYSWRRPNCLFWSLVALLSLFPIGVDAFTLTESALKASVVVDKQKSSVDKFTIQGRLQLETGQTADPAAEPVMLTLGPFSQLLQPGAFNKKETKKKTTWTFKGAKGGLIRMTITQTNERWTFTAAGAGLTLADIANPVTVSLQIGDDSGSRALFFVITDTAKKKVLKFPAGKKDDADGDGFTLKAPKGEQPDCDDQDPTAFPGAPELCDGIDNDCNEQVDESFDLGVPCSVGVGGCQRDGVKICAPDESGTVCNAIPGDPAPELCNGIDDDCNGQVDDGLGTTTCGLGACQHAEQNCIGGVAQICDPLQGASPEICGNPLDEDCNGVAEVCPPLAITITTPENLALFNLSQIAIAGTADPTAVAVSCNDQPVSLTAGSFSGNLTLHEGPNTLTCVARDGAGRIGTASIAVTLDTAPPRVTITTPSDGATLTSTPVTVTGMINDIVVGTVNELEALVTCNGRSGQVANRAFVVTDVPLDAGANTITCTAQDRAENVDSARISVTLDTAVAKQIAIASGNTQTGRIGALLPQPLVVQLTENGAPAIGKVVLFKVLENDGALSTDAETGRMVAVTTDASGQARIHFTLGTWAGAGNNRVQARATGFVGEALFSLSALPGEANLIVVDAGNLQTGVVGQPLPRPFIVAVIDQGNNRLGGVPVTFTVERGGGSFDGQPSMTVNTDSDGRAQAVLTLGPDEGFDNNMVNAAFPGNPGTAATFMASGKVAGIPEQTKISGVVLDNANQPVPGVTVYIDGSPLTTQSDDQGQFVLQPAPVGHVKLVADGTTAAPRDGRPWPTLEYELVTIAGRDNTIGMPIFLLPIDTPNGLLVDETTGGTLTLADVPGFALTIVPGSATFPDGSKRGVVSVTLVHPDKVPMVPNFGQQPQFIVTIQPAGVHFNPPAAMTIPNADGFAPGQKTEMYSFDHDLGQFVSIGPGTVSEDGMVIASDPGVGVIKGGWHCGGNPTGIGACEHECDDGNDCTQDFSCVGGTQCCHVPVEDGAVCDAGDSRIQVGCRPTSLPGLFSDTSVSLEIDDSCKGVCIQGKCTADHSSEIGEAAFRAISKICHDECIMSEDLRETTAGCLERSGIKIKCDLLEDIPSACAVVKTFNSAGCGRLGIPCPNELTLSLRQFFTPGCLSMSLPSVILHEMIHSSACVFGDEDHNSLHTFSFTDPVYGCQESCFPGSTGGRGFPFACQ